VSIFPRQITASELSEEVIAIYLPFHQHAGQQQHSSSKKHAECHAHRHNDQYAYSIQHTGASQLHTTPLITPHPAMQ